MSAVVWRGSFVATVLAGGCGPSIDALPLEELECREIARTSAGCSFVAVPVLHLASALGEAAGTPLRRRLLRAALGPVPGRR